MEKQSKIYVAGHRGLVGSALIKCLKKQGYNHLVFRTHATLDLIDQNAVNDFFSEEKPEYVFLAAAKVGGILANDSYPADFIYNNLMIQSNIIHAACLSKVKRLLFLGSSCIYPKHAPQPMKEEYLLTGPLEPTNRPYALAKIAGIEQCWSCNRQYGTRFLAVMPSNLYGPGDNYNLETSHVIPALIRKFHEAKVKNLPQVEVWGSGRPMREFLYSEDMADACLFLMNLPDDVFGNLLGSDESKTGIFAPPLVNIGTGEDLSIRQLAELIKSVTGFKGKIVFDASKPEGTPRKLLDVSLLHSLGWKHGIELEAGLSNSYHAYIHPSRTF